MGRGWADQDRCPSGRGCPITLKGSDSPSSSRGSGDPSEAFHGITDVKPGLRVVDPSQENERISCVAWKKGAATATAARGYLPEAENVSPAATNVALVFLITASGDKEPRK